MSHIAPLNKPSYQRQKWEKVGDGMRRETGCTPWYVDPSVPPHPHPQRVSWWQCKCLFSPSQWDENLTNRSLWRKTGRGKKKERKRNMEHTCVSRVGRREPPLIEWEQECYWGGEPLILSYCLNILYIPILRFNIKIEISTECCPWKHNSEKAHVQIETHAEEAPRAPPCMRNTHSRAFPSARFQDTVGKNRPLILKIYSTQHNPGFSMWNI